MRALLKFLMFFSGITRIAVSVTGLSLIWNGRFVEGAALVAAAALCRISLDLSMLRVGLRTTSDMALVDRIMADVRKA
jgi:hypothetical protein